MRRAQKRLDPLDAGAGFAKMSALESDIAGNDDDGDPLPGKGCLNRDFQDPGHLGRLGNQLAVVAAILEKLVRVSLLEIGASDLGAWDVGGNGQDGHPGAMAIVEAVDEVHVARAAASGANGELAGEMSLRPGGKGAGLLVANGDPLDILPPSNLFQDAVEGIAHDSEQPFDPGRYECVHDVLCDAFFCPN